ncbi:MAG: hypothetical protein LBG26_02205 [Treponema sp.]|nr:hypothetical protein [Treponema sp.]
MSDYFAGCLVALFCVGCHTGPSFHDDSEYRSVERDAKQAGTEIAITGTAIAADVDLVDEQAGRIVKELAGVETAISGSGLGEVEKSALLRQVSVAQAEAGVLAEQAAVTRVDVERLNVQLARQREINAALSGEHDKREAAGAEVKEELTETKEKLAKAGGQRNLFLAIMIALALAIVGFIVIRVLRFLRIIPV